MRPTGSPGTSIPALSHHYDRGDEFFRLWLSSSLGYSCALWAPEAHDTLDEAEHRKVDYWGHQLGLRRGMTAIDVGCGWGSSAFRLRSLFGVKVICLTLTQSHFLHVLQQDDADVDARLCSWDDFRPDRPVDGILCIEALEHFARDTLDEDERVSAYRRFFTWCADLLAPSARVGLQVIAFGNVGESRRSLRETPIARQLNEIFPETGLPYLSELIEAWESGFEVISIENAALDYVRTFRAWSNGLRGNRAAAERVVDVEAVDSYTRYLAAGEAVFRLGDWTVFRITLERRRRVKQ